MGGLVGACVGASVGASELGSSVGFGTSVESHEVVFQQEVILMPGAVAISEVGVFVMDGPSQSDMSGVAPFQS